METTIVMGNEQSIKFNNKNLVSTRFEKKDRDKLLRLPNNYDSLKVIPEGELVFVNDRITLFKNDGSATKLSNFDWVEINDRIKIVKVHKSMVLIKPDQIKIIPVENR